MQEAGLSAAGENDGRAPTFRELNMDATRPNQLAASSAVLLAPANHMRCMKSRCPPLRHVLYAVPGLPPCGALGPGRVQLFCF